MADTEQDKNKDGKEDKNMGKESLQLTADDGTKINFRVISDRKGQPDNDYLPKQDRPKRSEVRGVRVVDLKEKDPAKKCANCGCVVGATIKKLLRCSRCKKVYYCDVECQKFDWSRFHKFHCNK